MAASVLRRVPLTVLLMAPLPACSEKAPPEARVRAYVDRAEEAVEARDLAALKEMISEGYRDESGRNRRGLMGVLSVHFLRNESVHLLTRIARIRFPGPARAEVTIFAAMAGVPIPEADDLGRIRADLYRFDVVLTETPKGKWQLAAAAWRPAAPTDFFP